MQTIDGWETLCECGHPLADHRLDWDADDLGPDCTSDGCVCNEFAPVNG